MCPGIVSHEVMFLSRIWIPILVVLFFMIGLSVSTPDERTINEVLAKIKAGEPVVYDRVVSSSEIMAKIKAGEPVVYDNVIIKGNLYIEKLGLPEVKIELITFGVDPRIISLNASVINSSITITNSYIEGITDFETSVFNGIVNFENTKFGGYSQFQNSHFKKHAIFGGSRFYQDAQFDNCEFNAPAFFYYSIFEKDVTFEGTTFNNVASFWHSGFEGSANFMRSHFCGNYVDFGTSSFNNDVIFKESKFSGNVHFIGVKFNQSVDFSSSDLGQLDPNLLHMQWSFFQGHLSYNEIIYLSLIKKFKDRGQFEDARNCYYEYRSEKLRREPIGLTKFLDYLAWLSCGYGVRPNYTISLILALILSFGFIFWSSKCIVSSSCPFMSFSRRRISVFTSGRRIRGENLSFLQSLYFSLLVFFHTSPPAYFYPSGRWKYIVTFEDILGWFFLALFVIVLVNVIITW